MVDCPAVTDIRKASDSTAESRTEFVLELGRALHTYGVGAPALENVLETASERLGLEGQFFSTPTSIFAGFGQLAGQRTYLLRVEPGGTDLGRLARTDGVIRQVLQGTLDAAQGLAAVRAIREAPPTYGTIATIVGFALASGAAGRFLGGGIREIGVAAALGGVTGALARLAGRAPGLERVFEPVAAFAGAFLAAALSALLGGFSLATATLAGLIVLLPGMTLTTAMAELATRHLSSGTSRLAAAAITFLGLGLGVTLGYGVAALVAGDPLPGASLPMSSTWNVAALVVGGLGFAVLLKAERRDTPWIVLSGAIGFVGARLGGDLLGPELGVFMGALLVGLASNAYSRWLDRPSAVTEVPGILMLVPGSVGFRSVTAMLDSQVVSGVETAFRMVMIAVALVAGLLFANLAVPRRRLI